MSPNALALMFVVLAAGCATTQPATPGPTQAQAPRGCALGVPGSTAVAEDTADGIALRFTSKDKPSEMRERANHVAAQHGTGRHTGLGHNGQHGQGADHGLQMMQAPAARAVAEDIEGGSRVRFVATDPLETEALRIKLREKVDAMNATACTESGLRDNRR